jgi:hypothetical protein
MNNVCADVRTQNILLLQLHAGRSAACLPTSVTECGNLGFFLKLCGRIVQLFAPELFRANYEVIFCRLSRLQLNFQ